MIKLIVAYSIPGRVIGNQGKLPWHLTGDLQHFRRTTTGHTVVMGRRTFQSLPGPLPGRTNVVLTRDPDWQAPSVTVAHDLQEALQEARHGTDVWIMGGGEVYAEALATGLVDEIMATEVFGEYQGDTFFPELPGWTRTIIEGNDKFRIVTLKYS